MLLAMALTLWSSIFLIIKVGYCYVNLSRKKGTVASQSSTHEGAFLASRSIDGNKGQTYRECSHTALGHSIAWFQVDLGGEYSLESVKIYYRNDANWCPYRFRQFYLDVSNGSAGSTTTLTSQRKRCYKDNTTALATPPSVIDISCKETARYVIVETTYNAQEAIYLNLSGPVLEICEIEVYGCSVGRYGESCSRCHGCSTCDIISGACQCGVSFFGPNCSNACSVYCKGNLCNNVTGSCTNGCEIGYYKDKCKWTCNPGCKNGCNRNSGSCDNGCIDGKYGIECYDVCSVGCISNCERMTGTCMCKKGWQGEKCRECSPTFYGPSCEEECSPHCYNGTCYVNNGSCIDGCTRDYTGDKCTQGLYETSPEDHGTAIGAAVGASIFVVIAVVVGVVTLRLRRKRDDSSKAQKDERKESRIKYEKETTYVNRQDHSLPGKDHSLPDSHVHLGKRPANLKTQEIGLYEIMDSGNGENKTYENDVIAKTVAPVTNTSNDASEENGNVYLVINESQLNSSHYDELHVQN
ncbi:cell death abnormality protein 1-like isoform X1 [Ostrea edulis]|uniref:cell death abnormality protein 1-like isoform X1 n=1 Tax=Ostrea edulis TaxID=37623 RepID=UPI0024AFBD94|nr:cell death abnormality protein 1-like isoform X1 [Ostrea edulis]